MTCICMHFYVHHRQTTDLSHPCVRMLSPWGNATPFGHSWSWACGALSPALITLSFQPRRRRRKLIDLPGHWSLDSFVKHMSKGRWHLQPCEVTASSSLGSPEVINVYLKGRVLPNQPLTDDRKRGSLLSGSLFLGPLTHAVKKKQINDTICPTNHISGSRRNGENFSFFQYHFRGAISVQIRCIPVWHL